MTIQLLLMVTLAKSRRYLRCTQLLVASDIRRLLLSSMVQAGDARVIRCAQTKRLLGLQGTGKRMDMNVWLHSLVAGEIGMFGCLTC